MKPISVSPRVSRSAKTPSETVFKIRLENDAKPHYGDATRAGGTPEVFPVGHYIFIVFMARDSISILVYGPRTFVHFFFFFVIISGR